LSSSSQSNTINDSRIENNIQYGISLENGSGIYPTYNTIYNNIFNNTVNLYSNHDNNENYFNTTLTAGTNIIGGSWIAGNYWTDPDGSNFSDNCLDGNGDGICDSSYTPVINNTDYLALTDVTPGIPCATCSDCNTKIQAANPGDTVYLNTSIISHSGSNCIEFDGADGITFDCNHLNITGSLGEYDWYDAIYLNETGDGSNNNTISNCVVSNFTNGIFIGESFNNTVTNSTFFNNSYGIFLGDGYNYNRIINVTTEENIYNDFTVNQGNYYCTDLIENVTGSGGRLIGYYNYTVDLSDQTFSSLILCMGDNSILDNITIIGSDTIDNNDLTIYKTNNATVTNINSSGNYIGLWIYASFNNSLYNNVFNDGEDGMYVVSANNNTISNTTTNSNERGIYIQAQNNTFDNITSVGNNYGIHLQRYAYYNILRNSRITDSTSYGIYIRYWANYPVNNTFYNNFLNNTVNLYSTDDNNINYWNTTNQTGPNIIGGPYIGGNYWTDPDGLNFSDGCTDANNNSICDANYTVAVNNIDYLPLWRDCVELWSYGSWGECSNSLQTRTSTDAHSCGTTDNRSAISQSCESNTTIGDPGGGSSGGLGEVINVTPYLTKTWNAIYPGEEADMDINDSDIDVTGIRIMVKETARSVLVKVEHLQETPSGVETYSHGKVYNYFNIDARNLDDSDVKDAKMNFRVRKEWVSQEGINASTIKMQRWNGSEWQTLVTLIMPDFEDNDHYFFESETPGFSIFRVVGEQEEETEEPETPEECVDCVVCTDAEIRCNDKTIEICINETWQEEHECGYVCVGGVCQERDPLSTFLGSEFEAISSLFTTEMSEEQLLGLYIATVVLAVFLVTLLFPPRRRMKKIQEIIEEEEYKKAKEKLKSEKVKEKMERKRLDWLEQQENELKNKAEKPTAILKKPEKVIRISRARRIFNRLKEIRRKEYSPVQEVPIYPVGVANIEMKKKKNKK